VIFAIYAPDKPGGEPIRKAHFDAHRAYLGNVDALPVEILLSGPLTDDAGTATGSLFLVDAPDRATAEAFHHADPFYKGGLWQSSIITGFIRRRGTLQPG